MNLTLANRINHTATSTNPTSPNVFDINYDGELAADSVILI